MSINLGSAYGKVSLDASGVNSGAQQAVGGFKQVEDQGMTMGEKIATVGDKLGSAMSAAGQAMTLGVTVPIIGAGMAGIKFASDLNETESKVQQIFGNMSGAVLDWSKNANSSMGMTQQAALDGASTFALFGKSAKLSGNDLTEFSEKNVQMAADFASFYNTSPQDAIEAIGAAYRGQSEPIRKYNILLDEQSIKQEATKMHLMGANGTLTTQGRILAVNSLITKQGSAAMGDFGRTSGGLANQTRILQAKLQDSAATMGQMLLPAAIGVVSILNMLLGVFIGLPEPVKGVILVLVLMVAAIGPLLMILGSLISTVAAVAGAWPLISAALPVVGTALAGVAGTIISTVIPALVSMIVAAAPFILAILLIAAAAGLLYLAWINNFGGIQDRFAEFMVSWNAGIEGWKNFGNGFAAKWNEGLAGWGNFFGGVGNSFTMFGTNFNNGLAGWKAFGDGFDAKWQEGLDGWSNFFGGIGYSFTMFGTNFNAGLTGWKNFGDGFQQKWQEGIAGWTGFFSGIIAAGKAKLDEFKSLGSQMVAGIQKGFSEAIQGMIDYAVQSIQDLINKIKALLGISSPSKVFANFGEMSGAGLEGGFTKRVKQMVRNIPTIMSPLTAATSANLAGNNAVPGGGGSTGNSYDQRRSHDGNTTVVVQNPSMSVLKELMG